MQRTKISYKETRTRAGEKRFESNKEELFLEATLSDEDDYIKAILQLKKDVRDGLDV